MDFYTHFFKGLSTPETWRFQYIFSRTINPTKLGIFNPDQKGQYFFKKVFQGVLDFEVDY